MMFCVSTIGDWPETVTVSSKAPTLSSTLTVAVNAADNSMPSRLSGLKPVNVNVTVYGPGTKSTILYWPCPSVTAVRTFSISAGLEASTVTPGKTAPDGSLTTPAMLLVAWARADAGRSATIIASTVARRAHIWSSFRIRRYRTNAMARDYNPPDRRADATIGVS